MAEAKQKPQLSKAQQEDAARNRADYIRALKEELSGYERAGNDDRAKDVKDELARVQKAPAGRSASGDSQTA
jgi:hypothetical protein